MIASYPFHSSSPSSFDTHHNPPRPYREPAPARPTDDLLHDRPRPHQLIDRMAAVSPTLDRPVLPLALAPQARRPRQRCQPSRSWQGRRPGCILSHFPPICRLESRTSFTFHSPLSASPCSLRRVPSARLARLERTRPCHPPPATIPSRLCGEMPRLLDPSLTESSRDRTITQAQATSKTVRAASPLTALLRFCPTRAASSRPAPSESSASQMFEVSYLDHVFAAT